MSNFQKKRYLTLEYTLMPSRIIVCMCQNLKCIKKASQELQQSSKLTRVLEVRKNFHVVVFPSIVLTPIRSDGCFIGLYRDVWIAAIT